MDGKDIFYEIMKSPGMRKLLGESGNNFLDMDSEEVSHKKEVAVVRAIIEGQVRHTSDDNIFKNIKKLYDL